MLPRVSCMPIVREIVGGTRLAAVGPDDDEVISINKILCFEYKKYKVSSIGLFSPQCDN